MLMTRWFYDITIKFEENQWILSFQISYCADHPEHLPSAHKQWCNSYALYQKLVNYQQTKGKLEPKLPTKVLSHYRIPDNLNQVLGSMYEEKIGK